MRRQATPSLAAWPSDLTPPNGVLVLSGYGLSVRVWRGRLRIADGIGRDRREGLVHRATGKLRRLVVLGHTGSVSLEAVRWLADVGAGYLQVDADGRVLAAFGPQGADRPGLRRAQARALDTPVGDGIARRLIAEKVAAQAETLVAVDATRPIPVEAIDELRVASAALHEREGRDALRAVEARAASAYWSAWSDVPVAFARRDADRVPPHWLTFGSRTSHLTGGPRLATNPANAVLNYLYALLEGEATIAARLVGLDPGLGVMHADQLTRDSLAADLMEPVRPLVDRYVLELLRGRAFGAADFHETRQGACRVTARLAAELAQTAPRWATAVGRVAEDVALLLDDGGRVGRPMPTPLSGRNRAASRPSGPRQPPISQAIRIDVRCTTCGGPTRKGRRTCSAGCREAARLMPEETGFLRAGQERMRALRAAGIDPLTPEARARIAAAQSRRRRETSDWNQAHGGQPDPEAFRREVLPLIQGVSIRELVRRTGLSLTFLSQVRRGAEVPHRRWWNALAKSEP
jgi:CRISPR-associated endonuclease Cas1